MARKTMKMFPTFDNAGVHNSKCNCNTFYISFKIIVTKTLSNFDKVSRDVKVSQL